MTPNPSTRYTCDTCDTPTPEDQMVMLCGKCFDGKFDNLVELAANFEMDLFSARKALEAERETHAKTKERLKQFREGMEALIGWPKERDAK